MNTPEEVQDEQYQPTPAEHRMAQSINYLVRAMLRGELSGIALCAMNTQGEPSMFYLNKPAEAVLRGPMEELRVIYETNRVIAKRDNAPETNRSYRKN